MYVCTCTCTQWRGQGGASLGICPGNITEFPWKSDLIIIKARELTLETLKSTDNETPKIHCFS